MHPTYPLAYIHSCESIRENSIVARSQRTTNISKSSRRFADIQQNTETHTRNQLHHFIFNCVPINVIPLLPNAFGIV